MKMALYSPSERTKLLWRLPCTCSWIGLNSLIDDLIVYNRKLLSILILGSPRYIVSGRDIERLEPHITNIEVIIYQDDRKRTQTFVVFNQFSYSCWRQLLSDTNFQNIILIRSARRILSLTNIQICKWIAFYKICRKLSTSEWSKVIFTDKMR